MRYLLAILLFCLMHSVAAQTPKPYALVVHGGAGVIRKENMTPAREAATKAKLQEALEVGYAILAKGGTALDAVTATIQVLEDSGIFNAGKGAVRTTEGRCELDASIMNGATGQAGAIANVRRVKNPILTARAVMEKTPHVLLIGEGAEALAQREGHTLVDTSYFKRRYSSEFPAPAQRKYGTVGCVALDQQGNIAAGTSTGGTDQKLPGRVGDAPIIGAGTYAQNGVCGISATGHGEYFIRHVVAYDIAARMKYQNKSLTEAARQVIHGVLSENAGGGGVIGLDAQGNVMMQFNTPGMYRGYKKSDGSSEIAIYK